MTARRDGTPAPSFRAALGAGAVNGQVIAQVAHCYAYLGVKLRGLVRARSPDLPRGLESEKLDGEVLAIVPHGHFELELRGVLTVRSPDMPRGCR